MSQIYNSVKEHGWVLADRNVAAVGPRLEGGVRAHEGHHAVDHGGDPEHEEDPPLWMMVGMSIMTNRMILMMTRRNVMMTCQGPQSPSVTRISS